MATATINISIPESLKAEVDKAIASEGYGNTSEFFRDLVRDYLKRRQEKRLETMRLAEGERDEQRRLMIASYAAENAGTEFDLDETLETAGVDHLLTTSEAAQ
jgi:Arc/MetJ-type ribon-helix-helix transcriptional regulator